MGHRQHGTDETDSAGMLILLTDGTFSPSVEGPIRYGEDLGCGSCVVSCEAGWRCADRRARGGTDSIECGSRPDGRVYQNRGATGPMLLRDVVAATQAAERRVKCLELAMEAWMGKLCRPPLPPRLEGVGSRERRLG